MSNAMTDLMDSGASRVYRVKRPAWRNQKLEEQVFDKEGRMSSPSFVRALRAVSSRFDELRTFVARERVNSEAFALDRTICEKGDTIEVERWYCTNGPTLITVHSWRYRTSQTTCVPWGWVKESGGMPDDLATYMPPAPHSWPEYLKMKEDMLSAPVPYDEPVKAKVSRGEPLIPPVVWRSLQIHGVAAAIIFIIWFLKR